MTAGPVSLELSSEPHVLADGTIVVLRPVQPEDRAEILRGFAGLRPESRYQRFLMPKMDLSEDALRYLTEVDGRDHVAIVAVTDSLDLKSDVGLGIARFIRLPEDPCVAEAAVTVVDHAQGRGVGRLLLAALAEAARRCGIRTFRAEVLASNAAMRHLLDEAGAVIQADDGEMLVFDVPVGAPEIDARSDDLLRRILRAAAAWLAVLRERGD